MTDVVRPLIEKRLKDLDLNMAEVSRRLDMNVTYLQQFLKKGKPRKLPEHIRYALAEILQVPETELRGTSAPLPTKNYVRSVSDSRSLVDRRLHNANVAPSAGPGATPGAERNLFGSFDLPVYGTARGSGCELIISQRAEDWVARPSILMRVESAYALIVSNDAASPALKRGSTAWVDPHLAARPGDLCVFRGNAEGGPDKILIKEYRDDNDTVWKVRRLNPDGTVILKKSEWQVCHRIVGCYFP